MGAYYDEVARLEASLGLVLHELRQAHEDEMRDLELSTFQEGYTEGYEDGYEDGCEN